MKLRNIFKMLAVALILAFVGCEEPERFLDEVKVSKSYVTFPVSGAEVKVTVDAVADWHIVALDENFKDAEVPEWLSVNPISGTAGTTEVEFAAGETKESREVTLNLVCGKVRQEIKVAQLTEKQEAPLSTCNDVLTGGVVDKFYRIKGVVAEIPLADFQKYGKFFITDDSTTEKVQIYGCANKSLYLDGDKPKIEVGDIVVIEGSWSRYGNFNNDTQILSVEKSLIKVEKVSPVGPLSAEGDVFTVTLTNKGKELQISIPEADKEWLSHSEPFVSGTTAVVEFIALANEETPRSTTVSFSTVSEGVTYTATVAMDQDGALPILTIDEAVTSEETCQIIGKVLYVHSKGLLITDGKSVLYGFVGAAPEVAVDDIVSLTGAVTKYNGGRSMNKPVVAKAEGTVGTYRTPAPVVLDAEKFAAYTSADADFATPYVMITGVAETDSYGNLIVKLVDGETTYSVKSYYGNDSFADWAGKEVKAYGYAYNAYADSKQVDLVAVTVLDADAEEPTGPEISTIASVLARGQDAVIPEGTTVEGVVISNAELGNLTSKKGMYLQDESGAVQLRFTNDHTFAFGDKLQLDLSGVKVGVYNQAVQLSVDNTKAVLVSTGNTVTPKTVTMADFLANKYEGQYVALEGVQVAEGDLAKTWIMPGSNNEAAHTSINMEDAEGNTFVVFSAKYATYGTEAVAQGSGTIKGISAKNNATIQIIFAQESDFAGLTGARFGQEGGEEPGEKAARNLAFSEATATATLGEEFTAPTLSGETDGVAYSSSNTAVATVDAATGAVTLVAAGETTITAVAEETETLQAGTASYTLTVSEAAVVVPTFEAGKYWIVDDGFVGTPELKNESYGYMIAEEAWKSSTGVSSTEANAFTFEVAEGGYTIKDSKGRYLYSGKKNDGTYYNTFNASATATENHIWTVAKNADGTYKITNKASKFDIHYGASFKTFECVANVTDFPELIKVESAVPAVTLESSLTFEAEGGSQTITLPEGVTINPSSNNAAFTATASANVVTVSAAATTEAQSGVLTLVLNYNGFAITKTVDLTQKAAPVAGETVVLHETFDKCQNGDSFANNAANSSDTSIKTDVSGWTFVKGYEAYKSAKFGGSSAAGSATTPKLGVSGDMTVTFVATPWANDNTTLKLSVVGGGNLSVSTVTMKTSFSEHTVTITGATAETQLKFESNTTKKCRFFLDDVKIVKK